MTNNLNIYNTLSRKEENFIPRSQNKIGMYVCGPTVYDFPHIGNARPLVVFDILYRILLKVYGKNNITYVRNITDIDDKIIEASKKHKKTIMEITQTITSSFHEDCEYLNCLKPNFEPRATDHVQEMITMIKNLIENKHAYDSNKHVYFSVDSFKDYGKLSNKKANELVAGSRVEVSKFKKNSLDFVLWKPSEKEDPGWESPWGRGRPGWHLECSVMSEKYLGKKFDIHGGGIDLIFPHHENEIAQSCCANKTKIFANYWLHNGYVTFDKEKMSKSLGNIIAVKKLRESVNGQVVRLALLSSHYKQPLDWSEKLLTECKNTLDKWYNQFTETETYELENDIILPLLKDLNTPKYISKIHLLYDEAHRGSKTAKKKFIAACKFIGLFSENKQSWQNFKKFRTKIDENLINQKIQDRNNARKRGDYKLADNIRKELEANNVIIEDKQDQTTWKYK